MKNKDEFRQEYDSYMSLHAKREEVLVEAAKQQALNEAKSNMLRLITEMEDAGVPAMEQRWITRSHGDSERFKKLRRYGLIR